MKDTGIIGRYVENDLPVIVAFDNNLPNEDIRSKYPILTVVSWKYDGSTNNGMPLKNVNKKMIVLEDALEKGIEANNEYIRAYSRTGNNLKELIYYTAHQYSFMDVLNETIAKHAKYPIEISFMKDENWEEYRGLIKDFEKKK